MVKDPDEWDSSFDRFLPLLIGVFFTMHTVLTWEYIGWLPRVFALVVIFLVVLVQVEYELEVRREQDD